MLRYGGQKDRVTDHRINKSWRRLEDIMDGKIEKIIDTLEVNFKV